MSHKGQHKENIQIPMTSIFVAKLDFNTTEEQLKSLFEEHGRVNRVTIAKDRETGKPRGFAFVEMADESEADRAIEALDDFEINGRNIAVKKADDRASGGKPSGDNNRSGDRPAFRPREDRGSGGDSKPDYKKPDDNRTSKPAFSDPDEIIPAKVERKKEKDPRSSGGGAVSKDAPKKPKMEAYRKSGKDNQFLNDDDLSDEELDLFGRNGEEEDEEEDYRKYLVNSDEDSEEDYDDEDEWEDDEEEDEEEEK
jgi:RNA recognition motif-containing protein